MDIRSTYAKLSELLHKLRDDWEKAEAGNKEAGKRARASSVEIEKLTKQFRSYSIDRHYKRRSRA